MTLRRVHISLLSTLALAQAICLQLFTLWGGISPNSFIELDIHDILILWAIPQSFALALTFGLCGKSLRKRQPVHRHVAGVMASTILGMIDLVCISIYPESAGLLIVTSACAWGIANALMTMGALAEMHNFELKHLFHAVLGALALGSIEYVVLQALVQITHPLLVCVIVLIYLICMVAGLIIRKTPRTSNQNNKTLSDPHAFHQVLRTNFSQVLAFLCALAFSVSLTRTLALGFLVDTSIVNIAGALTIVAVTGVLWSLFHQHLLVEEMFTQFPAEVFRVLFSLVATSLLALAIFGDSFALLAQIIMFVLFSVAYVMLIVPTHAFESRMHLPHGLLFSQVSVYLFGTFGVATYLGAFAMRTLIAGDTTFSVVVIIVLYVVAMTYSFVNSKNSPRDIFLHGNNESSADQAATDHTSTAAHVLQNHSSDKPNTTDGDVANTPISSPTVIHASDESREQHTEDTEHSPHPHARTLEEALELIRADFGLTPREFDVLEFITHGRDVPTIARELVLSENTIRSHIKRLYNKLLAHSKQEVLDIVEGYMHPKH